MKKQIFSKPNTHKSSRKLLSLVALLLLLLLSTACTSDSPTATGAEPTPVLVEIIAPTVEPIVAPPATPTVQLASEPAVPSVADGCAFESDLDFYGHPDYDVLEDVLGCAIDAASYAAVAINEFGAGPEFERFMFWTSTDTMIYVLRSDNSWETHVDTWAADQPEILCNPFNNTFSSPPLPRRGFGKLWCELDDLAEEMGTVEREERLCQHAVLQRFENGQLLACFEDATYRYFRLMNDNSWETVFIQ